MPVVAEPATREQVDASAAPRAAEVWITVVWDDPVNLMDYVTHVFQRYFGYSLERAERLMLQVHQEGRAVVSRGNREQMEVDVQAMHGFGLQATLERAGDA